MAKHVIEGNIEIPNSDRGRCNENSKAIHTLAQAHTHTPTHAHAHTHTQSIYIYVCVFVLKYS